MLELHRRLAGEFNADVDRVKSLVTQAAETGYAPAINTLAVFVREGDFTDPADPLRACGLFAKAAELGDGKALFSWADCRARGVGGPAATAEEVASILRRAALAGSIGAQLTYGLARIKGELGPANPAEGRTFIRPKLYFWMTNRRRFTSSPLTTEE
jgi:TPR repeat protein